MKHETEHLIKIETPEDERRISERRKSDLTSRQKAERYDLLHDAVEGNPFQRLGRLERAIEAVEWNCLEPVTDIRRQFDLLELCLQRYASVLLQAQISNIAHQQAGEDVNRSPEAMRRCERNANEHSTD